MKGFYMSRKAISGKQTKYLVIKLEDLMDYFAQFTKGAFATDEEKKFMDKIPFSEVIDGIKAIRRDSGRDMENEYIVCNRDEPYADLIWGLILLGEDSKKLRQKEKDKERLP